MKQRSQSAASLFNHNFRKSIRVDGECSRKPNLNVKRVTVIIWDINHAPASAENLRIFYRCMSALCHSILYGQQAYTVSNVLCMYGTQVYCKGVIYSRKPWCLSYDDLLDTNLPLTLALHLLCLQTGANLYTDVVVWLRLSGLYDGFMSEMRLLGTGRSAQQSIRI